MKGGPPQEPHRFDYGYGQLTRRPRIERFANGPSIVGSPRDMRPVNTS